MGSVSNLKFENTEDENWNSISSQLCSEGEAADCLERAEMGGVPWGDACSLLKPCGW